MARIWPPRSSVISLRLPTLSEFWLQLGMILTCNQTLPFLNMKPRIPDSWVDVMESFVAEVRQAAT